MPFLMRTFFYHAAAGVAFDRLEGEGIKINSCLHTAVRSVGCLSARHNKKNNSPSCFPPFGGTRAVGLFFLLCALLAI
jgi:hypothetical protein